MSEAASHDKAHFVSVIVPAYYSDETIGRTLEHLTKQTYPTFEIVVIDSSPEPTTGAAIATRFPQVRYIHSDRRLLPHAARNAGIAASTGSLIVSTDPDVYPPPDWLSKLVAAHGAFHGMIGGAICCYEHHWIEVGMHFSKFDSWLPGGTTRPTYLAVTANMLCSRDDLQRMGGFREDIMLGDATLCWDFAAADIPITFVPDAAIVHHHVGTWRDLLNERTTRGKEYGLLRACYGQWNKRRIATHLVATISGLRLVGLLRRTLINAARARLLRDYFWVFPIVLTAHAAWLFGETLAYLSMLGDRNYSSGSIG